MFVFHNITTFHFFFFLSFDEIKKPGFSVMSLQLRESNFTKLCETTTILTVNDSLPGPEIRVRKGDTVYVNVHNQGDYGVTLHW